ncbi:cysteine-rich receptor-like protein kinase 15 [Rutidosis leptorrhynchoides]|uniref:cysteine-rich receptor-like protein kinase 15 n=1 Tax=Rutidosis leptorrhynchoides TaxID=125765 RepID=UPI003A9959F6
MSFKTHFLFLLLLLILCLTSTRANYNSYPLFRCQLKNNNFTADSPIYRSNIETALSSVSSSVTTHYGFNTTTVGVSPNTVTAIALCRGDISSETCNHCINNSIVLLKQVCSNKIQALVWTSNCMLSYSNRTHNDTTFYNRPYGKIVSYVNASNIDVFNAALRDLFGNLRTKASSGNLLRKFAIGDIVYGQDLLKVYGLMQCAPDLSSFDCNSCLSVVFREAQGCCNGDVDVAVYFPACFLRYSNVSFYNDPPKISLPAFPPSSTQSTVILGGKHKSSKIIYVVVPVVCVSVGLLLSIGLCFLVNKTKRVKNATKNAISTLLMSEQSYKLAQIGSVEMDIGSIGSLQFDLDTIEEATKNFCIENKIGEGGFGPVYKGVLASGMEIAVKRLSKSSGQGSHEFVNEVILMAKLQHRNLVRLIGFCCEDDEKLLIYDYISNKSLDYFLFDPNRNGHLDWSKRYKIIEGTTRGMLYLHQDSCLRIIHRDLKVSNILLDMEMNAKISDFGLARIFGMDQTQANTKRIVGTYGYMSPEYAVHGHFSEKSDVFAFGVVVLEIITGKKSSSFFDQDDRDDLPHFAWKKWTEGTTTELVDPTMVETCPKDEVMRCINIGLLCVQEDVNARPSMASVLNMLNNYSITIVPSPKRPPHYLFRRPDSYFSAGNFVPGSKDESLITEIHPR